MLIKIIFFFSTDTRGHIASWSESWTRRTSILLRHLKFSCYYVLATFVDTKGTNVISIPVVDVIIIIQEQLIIILLGYNGYITTPQLINVLAIYPCPFLL